MAENKDITVKATVRDGRGKNDARRTRRAGLVPVTVYGGGGETVAAAAPLSELAAILRSESSALSDSGFFVNSASCPGVMCPAIT